jgi:prefoldin subunit 5
MAKPSLNNSELKTLKEAMAILIGQRDEWYSKNQELQTELQKLKQQIDKIHHNYNTASDAANDIHLLIVEHEERERQE